MWRFMQPCCRYNIVPAYRAGNFMAEHLSAFHCVKEARVGPRRHGNRRRGRTRSLQLRPARAKRPGRWAARWSVQRLPGSPAAGSPACPGVRSRALRALPCLCGACRWTPRNLRCRTAWRASGACRPAGERIIAAVMRCYSACVLACGGMSVMQTECAGSTHQIIPCYRPSVLGDLAGWCWTSRRASRRVLPLWSSRRRRPRRRLLLPVPRLGARHSRHTRRPGYPAMWCCFSLCPAWIVCSAAWQLNAAILSGVRRITWDAPGEALLSVCDGRSAQCLMSAQAVAPAGTNAAVRAIQCQSTRHGSAGHAGRGRGLRWWWAGGRWRSTWR